MHNMNINMFAHLITLGKPYAVANIHGNNNNPYINGTVRFYIAGKGTQIAAEIFGLPPVIFKDGVAEDAGPFYGFHIHEGESCEPNNNAEEPFSKAMGHYNPQDKSHPRHAGDLPPLLADRGYAYMSVYTERFIPEEVLGKTVIIHQSADDFHSQPAGNSGERLACGIIERI